MSSDSKPIPRASLVRWRKTLVLLAVAVLAFIFLGGQHLFSDSLEISRSKIVDYVSRPKVDEVYGLIHLVTGGIEEQDTLTEAADGDPTKPIDLSVYAEGRQIDWRKEVKRLDTKYPIVVFSKTYCPYSKRAKNLLASYDIRPAPFIVEVDLRGDGSILKTILGRLTGRATFPNVIVHGKSIGGSDDLAALHESGKLKKILRRAGVNFKPRDA
ncbi:thioredoxin-like protein [Amanita rubescens]|nr:thioredoxin-like protein [Amanita rubescens]